MLGMTSTQPEYLGFIFSKFGACSKPGALHRDAGWDEEILNIRPMSSVN
jgi:hypothetical protein